MDSTSHGFTFLSERHRNAGGYVLTTRPSPKRETQRRIYQSSALSQACRCTHLLHSLVLQEGHFQGSKWHEDLPYVGTRSAISKQWCLCPVQGGTSSLTPALDTPRQCSTTVPRPRIVSEFDVCHSLPFLHQCMEGLGIIVVPFRRIGRMMRRSAHSLPTVTNFTFADTKNCNFSIYLFA
jgi:hypothetical protein